MYWFRTFAFPTNQQQNLPPPPSGYYPVTYYYQQLFPCQWCGSFYCSPFCAGRIVYQDMTQQYQHQDQYRDPSWGPIRRNQNQNGFRDAEAPVPNQYIHESSGTILGDGSTGIDPGMAWIGANDKTGGGKVWRTPSKIPLIVDSNLT